MRRIEAPLEQLPGWAREITARELGERKKPRFYVYVTADAEIPSNWNDYNVRHIYLRNTDGRTVRFTDTGYENAINDPHQMFHGKTADEAGVLPQGAAILIINHYPESVELYVREWDIKMELPPDVTKRDLQILGAMNHAGGYRQEYLRRARVTDADYQSLLSKGLIDRRRSITFVGRQVMRQNGSIL